MLIGCDPDLRDLKKHGFHEIIDDPIFGRWQTERIHDDQKKSHWNPTSTQQLLKILKILKILKLMFDHEKAQGGQGAQGAQGAQGE